HTHAIADITNLQTTLNNLAPKNGPIINGGILNGDPNNTQSWSEFLINSPTITDLFGAPKWTGDTGLTVANLNGLQDALNNRVTSSEFGSYQTAHVTIHALHDIKVEHKADKTYVQSRGNNLITNGTGFLRNNYNFSQFVFDQTEAYAAYGSFRADGRVSGIT